MCCFLSFERYIYLFGNVQNYTNMQVASKLTDISYKILFLRSLSHIQAQVKFFKTCSSEEFIVNTNLFLGRLMKKKNVHPDFRKLQPIRNLTLKFVCELCIKQSVSSLAKEVVTLDCKISSSNLNFGMQQNSHELFSPFSCIHMCMNGMKRAGSNLDK